MASKWAACARQGRSRVIGKASETFLFNRTKQLADGPHAPRADLPSDYDDRVPKGSKCCGCRRGRWWSPWRKEVYVSPEAADS